MKMDIRFALLSCLMLCGSRTLVTAQDNSPAATVNGQAILVRDVERELKRVLKGQTISPESETFLKAQALQQLVDRQLILENLRRTNRGASQEDIRLEVERLTKQLKQSGRTLPEHMQSIGMDEAALRRHFEWQIGWGRYLERFLTDENLAKHFEKHRRDFDGTKMRVAHILLAIDSDKSAQSLPATIEQAQKIRQEIVSGKITFPQAAAKYSSAPTANEGGNIGMISRRDPMPESFSRIAFALERDQISAPVVTHFGVHLITCLEIIPGTRTWQDAREDLQGAVATYLFDWTAGRERSSSRIEFSGEAPHFKPGTSEIVPGRSR